MRGRVKQRRGHYDVLCTKEDRQFDSKYNISIRVGAVAVANCSWSFIALDCESTPKDTGAGGASNRLCKV